MPTFPTQEWARRGGFVVMGAIHVPCAILVVGSIPHPVA